MNEPAFSGEIILLRLRVDGSPTLRQFLQADQSRGAMVLLHLLHTRMELARVEIKSQVGFGMNAARADYFFDVAARDAGLRVLREVVYDCRLREHAQIGYFERDQKIIRWVLPHEATESLQPSSAS